MIVGFFKLKMMHRYQVKNVETSIGGKILNINGLDGEQALGATKQIIVLSYLILQELGR